MTAHEIAEAARDAAQTMLDLAGVGRYGTTPRVRTRVVTRYKAGSTETFDSIEIAICGYGRGDRLGQSREDKAIRAALATVAAAIAPLSLEIAP